MTVVIGPNQTAWIVALASGKYPQAKGYLKRPDTPVSEGGFCCLGVAEEIRDPACWIQASPGPTPCFRPKHSRSPFAASKELQEHLKIGFCGSLFYPERLSQELIRKLEERLPSLDIRNRLLFGDSTDILTAWDKVVTVYNVSLTELNDMGLTFGEIADLLRTGAFFYEPA